MHFRPTENPTTMQEDTVFTIANTLVAGLWIGARGNMAPGLITLEIPPVRPRFWEAWPVEGGEPVVIMAGEPVVVRARLERGQLIVIGDTKMLFNMNLEGEDVWSVENMQFLRWLLRDVTKRGPE